MPTVDELRNLAHTGRTSPAIDTSYFPNTASFYYGLSSPDAYLTDFAWGFGGGYGGSAYKYYANRVRLVRSGQ